MSEPARGTTDGLDPRLGRIVGHMWRIGTHLTGRVQAHFGPEIEDLRGVGGDVIRRLGRSSERFSERFLAGGGAWPRRVRRALEQVNGTLGRWAGPPTGANGGRSGDVQGRRPKGGRPRRRRRSANAAAGGEPGGATETGRASAPAREGES